MFYVTILLCLSLRIFWQPPKINLSLSLSLSLLAAPAVLSVATFLALFLSTNNASAISDHSLSISTNTTTLESTINTIPDETITIQKHEITINTDNPNGAKLFISSKNNKTTPAYVTGSGPATGSGITGANTITESTGTVSAPTKLSPNSFGFALDKNSSTIATNFSTNTTYESTDNTDKLTAKFAKLPNMHNIAEIHNISTTANNAKFSLYYGTNTNSLMREGKYEMEVLYTVVSGLPTNNIPEENSDDIKIEHKYAVEQAGGYRRTVKTSIKSNAQVAKEDIELTINNKPCTDIEFIQGLTGDITKQLSFTCKVPANEIGKHDIKLKIPKLNINITKTNAIEYVQAMQNFTYNQCVSMTEHQEKTLGDKRDGELYTMAKLKDGKCWMTQNLRYQLSTTKVLTSQDSDVQQNWTPNRNTETTLLYIWNNDPEDHKTVRSYYDSTKPEYGTYYTHTAATAGTTANMNNNGGEATGSVCPKGWRLPKTTSDGYNNEFYTLAKQYKDFHSWNGSIEWGYYGNSSNMRSVPLNFVLSGSRNHSSAVMYSVGTSGSWWSSTVRSSNDAYNMYMSSSNVFPRAGSDRRFGSGVRCLAREPQTIGSIEYMQDMTPEHCANSTEHQTATLKDKRDNNTYIVAKLKDGKCWMTQNLRYQLSTTTPLTPTDSDVRQNWTPNRSTETTLSGAWDQDSEGYKTVRSYYDSNKPEYGTYYTHTAATAGTAANMNNDGDEATGSICPKGWRLPRTTTRVDSLDNDFYNIAKRYSGSSVWEASMSYFSGDHIISDDPIQFDEVGYRFVTGGIAGRYNYGFWWSSTIKNNTTAYSLVVRPDIIGPFEPSDFWHGLNVRCIAR